MTAAVSARAAARPRQLSTEALAVMENFPPRPVSSAWDATTADRFALVRRMLAPRSWPMARSPGSGGS